MRSPFGRSHAARTRPTGSSSAATASTADAMAARRALFETGAVRKAGIGAHRLEVGRRWRREWRPRRQRTAAAIDDSAARFSSPRALRKAPLRRAGLPFRARRPPAAGPAEASRASAMVVAHVSSGPDAAFSAMSSLWTIVARATGRPTRAAICLRFLRPRSSARRRRPVGDEATADPPSLGIRTAAPHRRARNRPSTRVTPPEGGCARP